MPRGACAEKLDWRVLADLVRIALSYWSRSERRVRTCRVRSACFLLCPHVCDFRREHSIKPDERQVWRKEQDLAFKRASPARTSRTFAALDPQLLASNAGQWALVLRLAAN
jgi:hypothetical protein